MVSIARRSDSEKSGSSFSRWGWMLLVFGTALCLYSLVAPETGAWLERLNDPSFAFADDPDKVLVNRLMLIIFGGFLIVAGTICKATAAMLRLITHSQDQVIDQLGG